jgi:hypothetical protein
MTDRINAFIVILDHDIREDEAEDTITALKQIKGVLSVQPHVADFSDAIAQDRVRQELGMKLWHILYPKEQEHD